MAERLLRAMGGRAAWARVSGLTIAAVHREAALPEPYDNRIDIDFARPRLRIEARGAGRYRLLGLVGERGWIVRDHQPPQPLPRERIESDLAWWRSHVYRNLQRLARRDAALAVSLDDEGRLVLAEGGERIAWFVLDAESGAPLRFGQGASEAATLFGPLLPAADGIRLPSHSERPHDRWRAEIRQLIVHKDELPADLFEAPAGAGGR